MTKYAILLNPGHNRVYYQESQKLSLSELGIAASFIKPGCENITLETIAENYYCTFETQQKLGFDELSVISTLSFMFALFEVISGSDRLCLVPVKVPPSGFIEDDITTILKYKGKTNELFTKLLVNIAALCAGAKEGANILDPMAGKGTTLFEGMTRGFNVCGIEQSKQFSHEGSVFVKKYLEQKRIKHISKTRTINNNAKKAIGKAVSYEYALNKEDFKSGITKQFELIHGDASLADKYYKAKYFDMIVTDLPYGVQHFGKTDKTSRNPQQLLHSCLPSWKKVLKSGGVAIMSFNTNVLKKQILSDMLIEEGFEIIYPKISFDHFVDNSIQRDLIIAKK
jgi:16S rRNA G966 N2-methylase RsmD